MGAAPPMSGASLDPGQVLPRRAILPRFYLRVVPTTTTSASAIFGARAVLVVGVIEKLPETVLPISTDSGMYATYARMLFQGARPYIDFYDIHPPLVYANWLLVEALAGTDWTRTCVGAWG